mmetsp:Transcript_31566/g.75636  ORF Transcript_31566/g.75636 Transcript_31566/m.75636 type:complete len:642 (+) Transcript_31566:51-1976(+)
MLSSDFRACWLLILCGFGKPHVVFILADDYGWSWLGHHARKETAGRAAEVHTPHLDSLVDSGILLDRHYAYKICSPSRSSLQSGRLPTHVNIVNAGVTTLNASDPVSGFAGIPRNMTGLGEKMRLAGYRTHMVGKWDAGMATPQHTPLGRGYETWLGYFQHANDYYRKNTGLQATGEVDSCLNAHTDFSFYNASYRGPVPDEVSRSSKCRQSLASDPACYEEHVFKTRALEIIENHETAEPLFLMYAFHLLHTPLEIPESYLELVDAMVSAAGGHFDSNNRRLYAAMTYYMDEAVGAVVRALRARDMWEDTVLIFASDNGGPIYEPGSSNNYPLKGGKYNDFEGGVRTNAFVSGGRVPIEKRGTVHKGVVSIADWYGTLCGLAGVEQEDQKAQEANVVLRAMGLPELMPVDSIQQWAHIVGGTNGRADALHLSEHAVLWWPYKLIVGEQPYGRHTGPQFPNCSTVHSLRLDRGPGFVDVKVFGSAVNLSATREKQDELVWMESCGDVGCLFNVDEDPHETEDLARNPVYSQIRARLATELQKLNRAVFKPHRGTDSEAACVVGLRNGGVYGPFVDADGFYSGQTPSTFAERLKHELEHRLFDHIAPESFQQSVVAQVRTGLPQAREVLSLGFDSCRHSVLV